MITPTYASPHRFRTLPDPPTTIPDLFERHASQHPQVTAVIDGDVVCSYQDLVHAAQRGATRLAEAGVRRGDVVALQLPNRWEAVAAVHAVWLLGAVATLVTPIYRVSELTTIFADATPRAVIVPGVYRRTDFADQATNALNRAQVSASVLDLTELVNTELVGTELVGGKNAWNLHERAHTSPDDVAMLMYTSGTTGRAKGVLHTHRTLLHESSSIATAFELAGDRVFMPSPLTHVTGMLYGILLPILIDGSVILQDRWDASIAVDTIEQHGCTFTVSATPFLRGLAEEYLTRGQRSSLRVFICGGADIPPDLVRQAAATMGTQVARTYGSTEMPTLTVVTAELDEPERSQTEGVPIGEARGRVVNEVDGVGELEVIGPELFVGYLDPDDNTSAFTDDGWFRTGDLARIDGGVMRICGRSKDLIIRGGENISAKEVEDVLLSNPDIADVAVIAIPDDVMGERACAVVVASGGARPTLADLSEILNHAGLAKQKQPEALLLVDALPRTPSGKIQKFIVRERVREALAAGKVTRR